MVEHDLAKVGVAGSSPVSRSKKRIRDEKFIPIKIGKSRFSLSKKRGETIPETELRFPALFYLLEGCPGGGMVDTLDLKSNEHYVRGGSSPPPGTSCENSSVGRARPCQGRGRGFESRFSLEEENKG